MKLLSRFLILLLFIPVVMSLNSRLHCEEGSPHVRVAVFQKERTLRVKVDGPYEITDGEGRILLSGTRLKTTLTTHKNRILLAGNAFDTPKVIIKGSDSGIITVNDRMFRQEIQFIKNKDVRLTVINRIAIEPYVKGIMYHEASHYWPMEALKVQAIVSRTYVLYQIEENKANDFDVTSDIYSQVYGGRTSERYRTNKAVEETEGKILTFQGKVFPAYFSATCAGHTEDASELWNIDMPPLKGVACGFCKESPHFNWHYVLTLDEIQEKLAEAGKGMGRIKDITILSRNKSGRVKELKIVTADKESKILAKEFRNIIGPNIIRSTNFKLTVVDKDAIFEGIGWGHGVGLCQWGAYFMAKQGRTHDEILTYYYPGSQITSY